MKFLLAFICGGVLTWAFMAHRKSSTASIPIEEPKRATLHEQMECATATERYAKANEHDPSEYSQYDSGSASLHSHYDPVKKLCVGMWDFDGFHRYTERNIVQAQWHFRSIDVFDPVEGQGVAGGYWKGADDVYGAKGEPVWGLANLPQGATISEFTSLLREQYGVSE
jgi:hypothetical protein